VEESILTLQELGFSKYEAQAYVGLLREAPVNGYELAKRSGVPRSMVYEVLGKLLDRGAAHAVPGEPVRYAPVPAGELIGRLKRRSEQRFDRLEASLGSLEQTRGVNLIRHVRGEEPVLEEIFSLVERAREELWLSLWAAQVPPLTDAVLAAEGRGVKVFSMLFEAPTATLGRTFHHDYMPPEVVSARMGGKLSVAARDGEEVVVAEFGVSAAPWAVSAKDPALVMVATEYLRHDTMIAAMQREFGAERLDALWRSDPDLSLVVTGKSPRRTVDSRSGEGGEAAPRAFEG